MQTNNSCRRRGLLAILGLICLVGSLSVPLAAGHTPPNGFERRPTGETVDRSRKGDRLAPRQTRREIQLAGATEPAATIIVAAEWFDQAQGQDGA
jgi:hypothetical protein